MHPAFQFSFFYYAIGISIVLSVLFALISLILVTRRLTFLAIGTEHAAFGGVGLAHILGWDQFFTTMAFCAVITVFAGHSHKKSSDLGVSLFFSGAMALGMILLSLGSGNSFNMMSFLFGDIIGVSKNEFIFTLFTTLVILAVLLPSLSKIFFLSFDRDTAIVAGINAQLWDTIVYIVLSVSIILGIRVVGVLLVAAMTVLPASFALLWNKNITKTLFLAFVFSIVTMVGGIILSLYLDIAPGSLIVSLAVVVYFIARLYHKLKYKL